MTKAAVESPLILDMVHHNPGEPPYESAYSDPFFLKQQGYGGQVFFLFDSPALAIPWASVDPDLFPEGTRERDWIDEKEKSIRAKHAACRAAGIAIYAQTDLILMPRKLVDKLQIEPSLGDPRDPTIQNLLRMQIAEMFALFPDLDGLVVRIGETYLHDAPYHIGRILDKEDPDRTIIPLMQLLREEVCIRHGKQVIFRSWFSFDVDLDTYRRVSDAVEPHPGLFISVKHCEGDFHRATPFSKVLGEGRHKQLIEVQCAREYEGKGAYPNYIANGVIEGFEEHAAMPPDRIRSIRQLAEQRPDLFAGIWTWSRGGGWDGPYIPNEMWCSLNASVLARWATNTNRTEEDVFNEVASKQFKLADADLAKLRDLCLLSAKAVVRGRNSTHGDMDLFWTRDQGIAWPGVDVWTGEPSRPKNPERNLRQKDESVALWDEIVRLAESIRWADEPTRDYAVASSRYGRALYEDRKSVV